MPSLLAIIPHPDDESYSFAATIAAAVHAGWHCSVVCCSDGERGKRHDGGAAGTEELRLARRAELSSSCALLGAAAPSFWGLSDGSLAAGPDQTARVADLIVQAGPDMILTLGSDGAYGHPDHIAVHRWVAAAWASLGSPPALLFAAFPRGLFAPQWHRCRKMMGNPPQPPVDSLGTANPHYELRGHRLAERKRSALASHRSQLPGGNPEFLFPPGIVRGLVGVERFTDARGRRDDRVGSWFRTWQAEAANG